jgi:hypothetical protein
MKNQPVYMNEDICTVLGADPDNRVNLGGGSAAETASFVL